jgi:hypothetical protein
LAVDLTFIHDELTSLFDIYFCVIGPSLSSARYASAFVVHASRKHVLSRSTDQRFSNAWSEMKNEQQTQLNQAPLAATARSVQRVGGGEQEEEEGDAGRMSARL